MLKTAMIEKKNARCPFLQKKTACVATARVYFPSYFQNFEYCMTGSHRICPFFRMANVTDLKEAS
jgi:hypothetical protein